jgi:hemerythrin
MKDIYHKWKTSKNFKQTNLFFDEQSESLIGVANIYLKALFYDSKHDYIVSIINTRGEVELK